VLPDVGARCYAVEASSRCVDAMFPNGDSVGAGEVVDGEDVAHYGMPDTSDRKQGKDIRPLLRLYEASKVDG